MKKIWITIKGFFVGLFMNAEKFEEFLRKHVDDAVSIVQQIKFFVDNNIIITILNIFPGKFGDKAKPILDKIAKVLDEVIKGLAIGTKCLAHPEFIDRLRCVIDALKAMPAEERDATYQQIAVNYTRMMSKEFTKDGTEIPKSVATTLVELKLQEVKAIAAGVAVPVNGDEDEDLDEDDQD